MPRRPTALFLACATIAAFYNVPAFGQAHEIQGIVVTNKDGQLTVKTPQGNRTITLPQDARVRSISGAFNANKEVVPTSSLIPGLPVTIDAEGSVAREIDYKAKDYKTAAQIQAGIEETTRRSEELRTAYSRMGDWDIRAEENVFFKTGSAVIAPTDKDRLSELAGKAAS